MTPDSTTQATLEDVMEHRKKITENPWPFPAEKMNYVIPMVEMSSILSLVEAQAKELTQMRERIFELATPRALDGTTIQQQRTVINALEITNQAQAKELKELKIRDKKLLEMVYSGYFGTKNRSHLIQLLSHE